MEGDGLIFVQLNFAVVQGNRQLFQLIHIRLRQSVAGINLILDGLHSGVSLSDDVGAFLQFCGQFIRIFHILNILFVLQLMIDAGSEVHGDGPDLHLYPHVFLLIGEEDRDLDDQVQAAIAVVLGMLNVILLLN